MTPGIRCGIVGAAFGILGRDDRISRNERRLELDRKQLIREYKQTPRPAGLFVVRNESTSKWFLGATPDLPGMLNRQRFQLEMGSHPDKELQSDWDSLGAASFAIEVLDELDRSDDAAEDISEDLAALKQAWLETLESRGQALYPMSLRRS